MNCNIGKQKECFENIYSTSEEKKWNFHDTDDILVRYLRDRRIKIAIEHLKKLIKSQYNQWNALVICGGVGGEGTLLADLGFNSVTVSDISENALEICKKRDPRIKTILLNAEDLTIPDNSYDLVIVQDGLHHLPRPANGFTEMLRVSKKAIIVIEPHSGIISKLFGTIWEKHDNTINYVFRWNKFIFKELTLSYLLQKNLYIKVIRLWDHNCFMMKISEKVSKNNKLLRLNFIKLCYDILNTLFWWLGNMMIGIIIKK